MEDLLANEIKKNWGAMRTIRSQWDSQFQEIVDLMRPSASDFTGARSPGSKTNNTIYDSTAPDALEEFAGGLNSFQTNAADRWFSLLIRDKEQARDVELSLWAEYVTNKIYEMYQNPRSGHTQAMSEAALDTGSFGTTNVYQWFDTKERILKFKTFSLADCWFRENHDKRVDTVYRRVMMTGRMVMQRFRSIPPRLAQKIADKPDVALTIIHAVFPRTDEWFMKHITVKKPWPSIWVCIDTTETLEQAGFKWFPYQVARWKKMADETYGRSPAMTALPDVKMLNRMEFLLLKATTKAIDPPIIADNDAFLLPLKTSPGAINYREPGAGPIERLEVSRGLPISEEKAMQKREAIRKYFHTDLLRLRKENVEMTAYEASVRKEDDLRLMAPMLSRQEAELLGPQVSLSYLLLSRHGELEPPPRPIEGSLKLVYTSPAAKAQTSARGVAMETYIQRLIPAAQINPAVMERIDWDAYSGEMAEATGVSDKILFTDEEMASARERRAAAEQQQAIAQAAEPASKAIKNLSDAGVSPASLL